MRNLATQAPCRVHFKRILTSISNNSSVKPPYSIESSESFVDLYAGVRYNSINLDLTATSTGTLLPINSSRSGDESWTDPIVGIRTQWDINDSWFLVVKGDIGGLGAASDFTWNLQGSIGYKFNECVSLEVGYRYFDTDYSDGGFTYDIAQSGALIGLNLKF